MKEETKQTGAKEKLGTYTVYMYLVGAARRINQKRVTEMGKKPKKIRGTMGPVSVLVTWVLLGGKEQR